MINLTNKTKLNLVSNFTVLSSSNSKIFKFKTQRFTIKEKSINKSFFQFQNKTFFNFRNTNTKTPFDKDYEINKERQEEWFDTTETLVFESGKSPIISASDSDKFLARRLRNYVIRPLMLFTGYKFVRNVVTLHPFRSIFWGGCFFLTFRVHKGLNINKNFFVYSLNLLEDGKRIEIIGEDKPIIVDIKDIRRLSPEESLYVLEMFPDARITYIPLVIKDNFYLIFKNSKVYDTEIFKAVTMGKYIRFKEDKIIDKDNSIDIDIK